MSKFNKFKNEELLICLDGSSNNAEKHPTEQGREFFRKEVDKLTSEIFKRVSNNTWDLEEAKKTEQFQMHLRNLKAREERNNLKGETK